MDMFIGNFTKLNKNNIERKGFSSIMSKRPSDSVEKDQDDDPLWNNVMDRADEKKLKRETDEFKFLLKKLPVRPDIHKAGGVQSFIANIEDAFGKADTETPFINSPMFREGVAIDLNDGRYCKWWSEIIVWTGKVDTLSKNKKYKDYASSIRRQLNNFGNDVKQIILTAWLKAHPKFMFEWRFTMFGVTVGDYMIITPKPRPK